MLTGGESKELLLVMEKAVAEEDFQALLQRVALLQPELAKRIAKVIEEKGDVKECLSNDSSLRRHVEKALQHLFECEESAESWPVSHRIQKPAAKPAANPERRSIRSSA